MKNMHILPTDKPTMLFKDDFGNLIYSINMDQEQNHFEPQHIYITSDEEIKDAKWIIHNGKIHEVTKNKGLYISVKEVSHIDIRANLCKKIILTTDPDLIKDGVQAIDDEFLEWFVKNPSCEEVEVKREKIRVDENFNDISHWNRFVHKIIIPKEETKQETLEEASKDYIENTMKFSFNSLDTKTQANRMLKCAEFGAKWQKERMYSEEEVFNLCREFAIFVQRNGPSYKKQQEWFEQFKKK
jgi:hypothetical protein